MNKQAIRGILSMVFGAVALVAAVGFINHVPETHAVETINYPMPAVETASVPKVEPVEAEVIIGEVTVKKAGSKAAIASKAKQHCYERVLEQGGRPDSRTVIYCD